MTNSQIADSYEFNNFDDAETKMGSLWNQKLLLLSTYEGPLLTIEIILLYFVMTKLSRQLDKSRHFVEIAMLVFEGRLLH